MRSLFKGIYFNVDNISSKKVVRVPRNTTIQEPLVDKMISVYSGNAYKKIHVTSYMIRFKAGSLVLTKKIGRIHRLKKRSSKKRR